MSSLDGTVVLPMVGTTITVSFHEENSVALVLARTLQHHITFRSKYYATNSI